jgi:hypothetical protein
MENQNIMKTNYINILLVVVAICGIIPLTTTFAQAYQPLPDSNASWLVQESSSEYTVYHSWFLSDLQNDTVINGIVYTKIFEKLFSGNDVYYSGAFRNDANGKTFYIPTGEQQEVLLQDFTVQQGDTVFDVAVHLLDYLGSFDFIVDSVKYFPCGPYSLKSVALHSIEMIPLIYGTSLHWIEKIGNISGGIFNQPEMGLNVFSLVCQSASDTIFYNENGGYFPQPLVYYPGNCDEFLAVDKPISNEPFSIYPNPFQSQLFIRSEHNYDNLRIDVYDFMGRLLITVMANDFSSPHSTKTFSNLKPGNYFLLITTNHKQPWKQIITKM